MKIVLANNYTKGKRLDSEMSDRIEGGRMSTRPTRLARKSRVQNKLTKSAHKLDSQRNDLTPEDAADAALIRPNEEENVNIKVVSESGDVIYSPGIQTTQYSARRAIKQNLERRIPGATVTVRDVAGDGLVRLALALEYDVNDTHVTLDALGMASTHDMTIVSASIYCNEKSYNIDPMDQARTPEDTAVFLKRLASNCASL